MKRKLFLLLCALLTSVSMWAQVVDVSSKLVASGTNWPNFSSEKTGGSDNRPWQGENNVNVAEVKGACTLADFKFAEVYYDKTTGSKYTVSQTVTDLDNGIYKLRIAAFARKQNIWGDDNGKSDQNNVRLSANNSSTYITTNVMAYYELVAEVTDGTLTISISGVNDSNKSNWMGYTDATLLKLFSGSSYPADVTGLITNPSFDGGTNTGWTMTTSVNGNNQAWSSTGWEYWSWTAGSGGFDYYQTLTGLPNGRYTISAKMFNDQVDKAGDSFEAAAGVYATSGGNTVMKLVDVQGSTLNKYTTDEIVVTNGTLRIGAKNDPDKTMTARWFVMDEFELTYLGPVVASGTYYLYDATNKVFASRGKNYGTRFTVDKYGMPIVWDNWSQRIRFIDNGDRYLFFDNTPSSSWLYTDAQDNQSRYNYFAFVGTTGGYYLKDNNQTVYVKHDGSVTTPTTTEGEAAIWTLKNPTEYSAIVAAYPTDNKTAVITAASLTAETDAAGFEAWLTANRAAKDKTSSVATAKFSGSNGKWTWTATRSDYASSAVNYGTDYAEAYQRSGDWTHETISELPNGIYKVTVNAFERATNSADCNTIGDSGWEPVTSYFEANGQQVQLKSWYSDKTGTNNPDNTTQAVTAFNSDKYKNEVYTYVSDGTLTLKLNKPSCMWSSWVLFNNVTLTYYDTNVSDEDATAILAEAGEQMAKPMLATLCSAISDAKETFDADRTVPNYNALRAAIDASATSVDSYAAMKTNYLDPLKAVLDANNFYSSSARSTVYDTYKTQYDEGTIANATATSLNWKSGTRYEAPVNNMMMDIWKIGNTAALTDNSGLYINTWSTESAGEAPAKDFENPFYEYWVSSGSLPATTLTGKLAGLTANTIYKITANVRVQGSGKVAKSITMQVGDGAETDVTAGSQIGKTERYIGSYSAIGITDGDGNLTLAFNVAGSSNISWLAFRDVNYEAVTTVADAKNYLNARISAASALLEEYEGNVGSGVFQIPTSAETTFSGAITTATTESESGSSTLSSVTTAATTLNTAINAYDNVTLNAPDAEKRYWVTIVEDGKTWNGNAITFIAGGRNDQGNYAIKYLTPSNANLCQALKFTAVEGNKYKISAINTGGIEQYLTTNNLGGYGSNKLQIRTTDDASKALEVEIKATTTEGQFQLYNTDANAIIANNNNNDMYTANSCSFTIAEASKASAHMIVSKTAKKGTFCAPFAVSIPSKIKAYTAAKKADEDYLELTEVTTTIPAGTPVILEYEGGESNFDQTFTDWATRDVIDGDLIGVYEAKNDLQSDEDIKYYIMQYDSESSTCAFYLVPTNATRTVGANRCYLKLASGETSARIAIGEADVTGINEIEAIETKAETMKDGKYLVNGRIVIVNNGKVFGTNGQILK